MKLPQRLAFWTIRARSLVRSRLNGKHVIGILCDTDQGLFVVDPADMYVGRSLALSGRYDPTVLRDLLGLVSQQSRVCVLGAHLGALLVPLAKRVREAVAYEANPRTFQILQANLKLNDVHNCRAYNLAVGEKAGSIALWANTANSGGSKRKPRVSRFAYTYDAPEEIEVPLVTLDEHQSDHEFDLVVMDIEGSEYFALQGMADTLSRTRHLQMEYLPDHLDNCAGVSDAQLVALLAPHFDRVRVQGGRETASRDGFVRLLRSLRERNFGGDLVFSKSSP